MKQKHIIQSKEWGQFKTKMGTKAVFAGNVQFTVHTVPYTQYKYAYCPKPNLLEIDWKMLLEALRENKCFVINFDVPNILKGTDDAIAAQKAVSNIELNIKSSPKNTFTKNNILLDISKEIDVLFSDMHKKHRYNTKYAERKGVQIRFARTEKDFDTFYALLHETALRQKWLEHPKKYYKTIWELFAPRQMAEILIAEYQGEPLAAWMLFIYEDILYYPYGGSTDKHKNLYASNLIGWEAIKYGKKRNCKTFDMWGACKDLENSNDPEWGFTNFKLKFGGDYVEYMDSYDLILNPMVYNLFTFAYPKAIKIIKLLKR